MKRLIVPQLACQLTEIHFSLSSGLCLKPHCSVILHFLTAVGKSVPVSEEREVGFLNSQMSDGFSCMLICCSLLGNPKE